MLRAFFCAEKKEIFTHLFNLFLLYLPKIKRTTTMNNLPTDPFMLVSTINMLLRDNEYDSLESLCQSFDKQPNEVKKYLREFGFEYNQEQKRFQ